MAHITTGVEYGLHCLLYLVEPRDPGRTASVRDLADLQGVPVEFVAKLFTKLQKAGLVAASEGARGGFRLARNPQKISVLDVIVAIDGEKQLFECREIRGRCAVFGKRPPQWATRGFSRFTPSCWRPRRACVTCLPRGTRRDRGAGRLQGVPGVQRRNHSMVVGAGTAAAPPPRNITLKQQEPVPSDIRIRRLASRACRVRTRRCPRAHLRSFSRSLP